MAILNTNTLLQQNAYFAQLQARLSLVSAITDGGRAHACLLSSIHTRTHDMRTHCEKVTYNVNIYPTATATLKQNLYAVAFMQMRMQNVLLSFGPKCTLPPTPPPVAQDAVIEHVCVRSRSRQHTYYDM